MKWLMGVDEAGYGPKLGPLVVAVSSWRLKDRANGGQCNESSEHDALSNSAPKSVSLIPETVVAQDSLALDEVDLFERFAPDIGRCAASQSQTWLRVDDSKKILALQAGMKSIERVIFGATLQGQIPPTARALRELFIARPPQAKWLAATSPARETPIRGELNEALSPQAYNDLGCWRLPAAGSHDLPWYDQGSTQNESSGVDEWQLAAQRFQTLQAERSTQLMGVAARQVEPWEFNLACERWGNKATVLSLTTLALVKDTLESLETEEGDSVLCRCDRHGGRAKYAALIQTVFPEFWVDVLEESKQLSRYRFQWHGRSVELRFQVRSEQFFETAWASLHAKYLRELAMDEFNDFWGQFDKTLMPTRGYPVDAKRFFEQIKPWARKKRIWLERIWRAK